MLDRPQLDALDRDGYVVLPAVLEASVVDRLRAAFDGATRQDAGTQHVVLSDATPEVGLWRALADHPAVTSAAAHVLGRPARVRDLHGRNPLPGFGQQGLHTDAVPRAPGAPFVVVTAIWMLDDFTPDSGATRVVPGSHRVARPLPKALAQPLAHHRDEIVITGRAGSVLCFNGHLWHSGRRNQSAGPRRAGQMLLVPA